MAVRLVWWLCNHARLGGGVIGISTTAGIFMYGTEGRKSNCAGKSDHVVGALQFRSRGGNGLKSVGGKFIYVGAAGQAE